MRMTLWPVAWRLPLLPCSAQLKAQMKLLTAAKFLSLVLLGCQAPQQSSKWGGPDVLLPLTRAPKPGAIESGATAAFTGRLILSEGCVRVVDPATNRAVTVLWHHETELIESGAGYGLRNRRTGITRQVGEIVRFGGGGIRREAVEMEYPEIAARCGDPYLSGWLSE